MDDCDDDVVGRLLLGPKESWNEGKLFNMVQEAETSTHLSVHLRIGCPSRN